MKDVLTQALLAHTRLPWLVDMVGETAVATVSEDGRRLGQFACWREGDVLRCALALVPCPGYDRHEAWALVGVARQVAADAGATSVSLDTHDELARHEARRWDFRGELRKPLVLHASDPASTGGVELAHAVGELVPAVQVSAGSRGGGWRRLTQSAVSGVGPVTHLDADTGDGRPPFRLLVPERDDVMVEAVALTVDTVRAIRARFTSDIDHVRRISFDHTGHGMVSGRIGGQATLGASFVHINAAYCCADLYVRLLQQRAATGGRRHSARSDASTIVEKVVAHELGHHLDGWFQSRRYRESITFRRQLGRALGVETIEHAILGRDKGASPAAREAWIRLAQDVSLYATTNVSEAVAELFAVWWFSGPDRPPIVETFGHLMDEYFPPRNSPRAE